MNSIDTLAHLLSKLPGIGPRQARRIVYHLLRRDPQWIQNLTRELTALHSAVHTCKRCRSHFESAAQTDICETCQNANLKRMMVVEKETDLENIRKAGVFDGRYFVLGGLLPITTKRSVQTFSGDALLSEVNRAKQSDALSEIILGLPVSAEGDHTADYLRNALSKDTSLMVTILGRGLSTGADLEYSDDKTLKSALQNRC